MNGSAVSASGQDSLTAAADSYPPRRYAWSVVAILVGTAILSYTDRQVLSLLIDPVRHDLGINDGQMGLLLGTAFAIVYGTAGIPLGYLADRLSRRYLIFAGVLVWSLGTIACGFASTFAALFAARLLVGLGEAVLSPAAISMISDYFPPERRGFAVGCFLSGIAIGIGASILIGGGVLHAVQSDLFGGSALARIAPWRLVLLLIGTPGLLWAFAILLIREPRRRASSKGEAAATAGKNAGEVRRSISWWRVAPVYIVVAMASLVDNAVGAWAPSLLIRHFHQSAADVGVQLGVLLAAAFGGGVLCGGWLADQAGVRGGLMFKLGVCLCASVLIMPTSLLINSDAVGVVRMSIPLYFALSGIVTACGFSAILDVVPNGSRGFAMAVSFFLNVALGAGIGPPAVGYASERIFGAAAGLGPAIAVTAAAGYGVVILSLVVSLMRARRGGVAAHS